ncbi:MAG: DUF167 domain-containing protein, partial [Chitinophagaceae bacterium]
MIKVKISTKPGSKIEILQYDKEKGLSAKIKALPVEGKANKYIISFISERMNIHKSKIELVSGFKSRNKTLLIHIDESEWLSKLGELS